MKLIALASGLFFVAGNAMAAVKTCQTAAEINAHLESGDSPEEFCIHEVKNPTLGLVTRNSISALNQLNPSLQVAYLNKPKSFHDAQRACRDLGLGWHAPEHRFLDEDNNPTLPENGNVLEAIVEYFTGVVGSDNVWIWSSTLHPMYDDWTWYGHLKDGHIYEGPFSSDRPDIHYVACVRP